MTQHLGAYA